MPAPDTLALFAAATAVLLLIPGPSVLFIAGAAAARLRRGARLKRVSGAAYIGLGALTAFPPA
jgi:threonine/homoserine/homoserine lactone efflux protein